MSTALGKSDKDSGDKIKFMRAILLMLSFSLWATQSIGATDSKADLEPRQEKVILKWLGTAGWKIEMGKTIILIDPFLTRKDRSKGGESGKRMKTRC